MTLSRALSSGPTCLVTAQDYVEQVVNELGDSWLPILYRERILKIRTRSYDFGAIPKKPVVAIHHTLLGVELKIGRRRFLCPDLATARYLSVFAKAGCKAVAIPYDITRISRMADEVKSSWHRMFLVADQKAADRSESFRTRIHGLLIAKLRSEITGAGAGRSAPEFHRVTNKRS